MAYARTKAEFDTAMDAILKESRPAATYLRLIPAETWATHVFPLPRYGHITSNIVESLNGTWKHLRQLSSLWLSGSIWSSVMETFCERRERVQTSPDLTNTLRPGLRQDTRSVDDTEQSLQMRVLYRLLTMIEKIGL